MLCYLLYYIFLVKIVVILQITDMTSNQAAENGDITDGSNGKTFCTTGLVTFWIVKLSNCLAHTKKMPGRLTRGLAVLLYPAAPVTPLSFSLSVFFFMSNITYVSCKVKDFSGLKYAPFVDTHTNSYVCHNCE